MVVIEAASASLVKLPVPSIIADTLVGWYGFVMSMIWTPLSEVDATKAYVDESMVVVVIEVAPRNVV